MGYYWVLNRGKCVRRDHGSPMQSPKTLHLEQMRRRKGITLETIAESTKISTRFLKAIEAGDYSTLPGGVFDTNYIRQYASVVGISPDPILARYQRFREALESPAQPKTPPKTRPGVRLWLAALRQSSLFARSLLG